VTTTAKERRFMQNADANPGAYQQYVQQKYGFSPRGVEQLLEMHQKLTYGGTLDDADVKLLQQLHPQAPPRNVAALAAGLNKEHGPQRADFFIAALTSDVAGINARFGEVGNTFKHVQDVARVYHVEQIADEINKRRDGGQMKPEPAERAVDPHSTREIISRQLEPKGARAAVEAVERGDPAAVSWARNNMADKLDAATATLYEDDKASLRDVVSAAFDTAEIESHAENQGWATAPEA
jgi:hypothetical protein